MQVNLSMCVYVALRRARCVSTFLAITALLASCQTTSDNSPAMSLDDAKKITATLGGTSFIPPPKTIADVTATLDAQPLADPEAFRKMREEAIASPPITASKVALAEFFYRRGHAARQVGDVRQWGDDLARAATLAKGSRNAAKYLRHLSTASFHAGKYRDAISHARSAIQMARPSQRLSWTARLAFVLARDGDLQGAQVALASAEAMLKDGGWRGGDPTIWWSPIPAKLKNPRRWKRWTTSVELARAAVHDAGGRFAEAEPLYRSAIRRLEKGVLSGPYRHVVGDLAYSELAENLLGQGRLVEAEIEAGRALTRSLRRGGRYHHGTGLMLLRFIIVLNAQGRFAEAQQLAAAALDIYRKIGVPEVSLRLLQSRQLVADALFFQRRWSEAATKYATIEAGLVDDPDLFRQVFGTNVNRPLSFLMSGHVGDAVAIARQVVGRKEATLGDNHYDTAEARGVLAMSLAASGDRDGALSAFRRAVPILLQRSRRSDDASTSRPARDFRLRLILESYVALLGQARDPSSVEEAFRIANAARGKGVQRALDESAARAAARDPSLADLARREQDALRQIGALNGLLANVMARPADQRPDASAIEDLRTRVDRLRGARAALMEEIEARFPDYAELINPKPATIAQARSLLGTDEALVSTFVSETRTYVWAIPKHGEVAFAAVELGRKDLTETVARLRRALDSSPVTLGDIPAFDVTTAYRLYKTLLLPVKAGWGAAKSLLVVGDGPLGYLPLSLLPTEEVALGAETAPLFSNYKAVPWLARSHAVTTLPSVVSLKTLRKLPPGDGTRTAFAGFGDPWFSEAQAAAARRSEVKQVAGLSSAGLQARGRRVRLRTAPDTTKLARAELAQLPRLPDTAEEVRGIARALNADPTTSLFLGKRASEDRVKTMDLSGVRVLAFATHGLVPGDLNGLMQPALALSSPAVVGGKEDGLLTMGEILGLKLNADWAVLSACNTGSGTGAGAEAVSGLGRAFFYAGTRALLVSNWPVETTSAKALTTDLFRRQAQDPALSRAEALHRTMVGLIDRGGYVDPTTGKTAYSYAHPFFWAPFTLVGDGGKGSTTPAS